MANEALKVLISSDVQKALFPNNSFYEGCQSDAAGVDVDTITIPQDETGTSTVLVNPTKLPLETVMEEDTKKTYSADFLITNPQPISWNNQLLTSYNKRAAKLYKHTNSLMTSLADRIMYGWAPSLAANIKSATGTATRAATAPGATGTRKVTQESDWIAMMTLFNTWNIPVEGRRVVIPPPFLEDILAIKKTYGTGTDSNNALFAEPLTPGAIARIFTFEVFLRSRTTAFDNTGAKRAVGSAGGTTDFIGAIFFHPQFVRYVKGTPAVFMDPYEKPELAGGVGLNVAIRGGGTASRNSQTGVAALIEA
jgi:hypothetical protein